MNLKKIFQSKIVKAGGWYTLSNFFLKGLSFLSIPIFTRMLNLQDYGKVSVYSTWMSIFTIFLGLGLYESVRRAKFDYEHKYDEYVSSIASLLIFVFIIYVSVLTIFANFFSDLIGLSKPLFYFLLVHAFLNQVYILAMIKYRIQYRYKIVSILGVVLAIASLLFSVIFIVFSPEDQKYLGKIIGNGIPILLLGIFFLFNMIRKGKKIINLEYWKYGLLLGFPLIFHSLGLVVNGQIDRIIIDKYLGSSVTGIYSFAYQIGIIIHVLFVSLDQAWNPWFFEKFKNNEHDKIRIKAKQMRNVFTVLYGCVLMISPEIIKIMAHERYWSGLTVVPFIFMAGYFQFMYALEVNVEYSCKRTELIALGTLITAAINIVLNIIFIPIYGYIAAAITTVISYYLLFLFHYLITSKILKIKEYGFKFHLSSTIMVISITGVYLLIQNYLILRLLTIIITLCFFYIWYSKKKKI